MAEREETPGHLCEGGGAVAVDMRIGQRGLGAAHDDERKPAPGEVANTGVVDPGPRKHDAVGAAALDEAPIEREFLGGRAGGQDHEIESRSIEPRAQRRQQLHIERLVEMTGIAGEHDAHRLGGAQAQPARRRVRPIIGGRRRQADALAGRGRDIRIPVERPRDRRDRQPERGRQRAQCTHGGWVSSRLPKTFLFCGSVPPMGRLVKPVQVLGPPGEPAINSRLRRLRHFHRRGAGAIYVISMS